MITPEEWDIMEAMKRNREIFDGPVADMKAAEAKFNEATTTNQIEAAIYDYNAASKRLGELIRLEKESDAV